MASDEHRREETSRESDEADIEAGAAGLASVGGLLLIGVAALGGRLDELMGTTTILSDTRWRWRFVWFGLISIAFGFGTRAQVLWRLEGWSPRVVGHVAATASVVALLALLVGLVLAGTLR